jgi:hypothetical protein
MAMKRNEFEKVVAAAREDVPAAAEVDAAAARVWARLSAPASTELRQAGKLRSCGDFRSLIEDYLDGGLSDARRMLFEDHTHRCVDCRRALERARAPQAVYRPPAAPSTPWLPWGLAAAALALVGFASFVAFQSFVKPGGARATIASLEGQAFRVAGAPVAAGTELGEGEAIRTAKGSRAVLALADGSRVEVAERSELGVTRGWRGATIHLQRGSVIVEAAKQRSGYLRVATRDSLVSVKGTIFAVTAGLKGSRVAVVEGAVKVEHGGAAQMLKPGDQAASDPNVEPVPLAEEIAWSANAAKYLALLGELAALEKQIAALPGPALRYEAKLARFVPANAVVYAAIPNIGPALAEATRLFEERVRDSAVLKQYWKEQDARELRHLMDRVKLLSDYLGDEVVIALTPGAGGGIGDPLLIAEVRKPGLKEFLEAQAAQLAPGAGRLPVYTDLAGLAAKRAGEPAALITGGHVLVGADARAIAEAASGASAFPATPFFASVHQAYRTGAGWLFAAAMEQIARNSVRGEDAASLGLDNVDLLLVERRDKGGKTETRGSLAFRGERRGVMAWLAAPGPMGSLEFVSPEASFAAAFVVKNPRQMLEDALGPKRGGAAQLGALVLDAAAGFGGEFTFAADGPLLPVPSFKLIAEAYSPQAIDAAIERSAEELNRQTEMAGKPVTIRRETVNGRTFTEIRTAAFPVALHYTYADSYLIAAPDRALLESAIALRSSGGSLPYSGRFRSQLPRDSYTGFSALAYYNFGVAVGPLADTLKNSGLLTPEQQKAIDSFEINREPSLIYAYGRPDAVTVASTGSFFGFGLDSLAGMVTGKGNLLPELLGGGLRFGPAFGKVEQRRP